MGEVFRGFDERLDRPVALKQIRSTDTRDTDEMRERFRREARAMAKLDHPSIVRVHDWVETDGADWLVMELVEGRTLKDLVDSGGALEPDRAVRLALAIAGALATAHDAGILHRDLKAENVMLTADGTPKLLDFGLAKRVHQDQDSTTEPSLTDEGKILGTVTAMSPEQALGEPLDARSDLFAFGSLVYRLVAGRSPFEADSPMATLRAIVAEPHRRLRDIVPSVPAPLSRLVDDLLEKDRDQRPRDAHQVLGRLEEMATASLRASAAKLPERRERRPVTVVALGPAAGSGTDDPEKLLDQVPWVDAMVNAAAERWGGRVEGRVGPSWIVCFGVPTAREDDARRAVHAALELLAEGADSGQPLAAGVHSGTAVVTLAGGREELALGPTFDVAASLQARAEAHGALASDATRALAARFFAWDAAGETPLVGGSRTIFRVEAASDASVLDGAPSTQLVGRCAELEQLLLAWHAARDGAGRVVRVTGEPGLGKSRLLGQLRRSVIDEERARGAKEPAWIEMSGSTVGRSSPFQPVVRLLRATLGLRPGDPPKRQLAALEAHVAGLGLPSGDLVPHLAALLGVPLPGRDPSIDLDPGLRKRRIQEALATLWIEQAEERPMVFAVEDLQWMDPSTVDLLTLLVEQAPTVPMLLVATHRLDFHSPWGAQGHVSEVRLERLGAEEVERLAEAVAGAALPTEVIDRVAAKADGVPLFVEELTRAVIESEQLETRDRRFVLRRPVAELVVPATLQESLTARLDRLGPARPVAQMASVVGRAFSREHLVALGDLSSDSLDVALDRLVEADLVHRRGFGRRARFLFRHALIHDAAYGSLLRRNRRELHARLAEALEYEGETEPEVLAHHLTRAGRPEQAIPRWREAGEAAFVASANREAADHFRQGLAALANLPEGRERDLTEVDLLTRLGRALSGMEGYSSPRVLEVYERAEALASGLGDEPRLLEVTWGLWAFYNVRAELPAALAHARQLLRLTETADDPTARLVARSSLGNALYFEGDLEAAREHSEAAIEEHEAHLDRVITTPNPQDLGVLAPLISALAAWHLGAGEDAVRNSREALELAESLEHSYSQVLAGSYSARLHQSRRDVAETRRLAEEVIELSQERGFFWITQGWFFRGCALAQEAADAARESGEPPDPDALDEALEDMTRGLEAYRRTGARLSVSYMLAQLVEAHLWRGDLDAARARLGEAEEVAGEGLEGFWRPELRRLAGEIAHAAGDDETAESEGRAALALAESAGDVALALRAALFLARLAIADGREDEAADLLAVGLGPFDAFAEDGDIREARRLFAGLG